MEYQKHQSRIDISVNETTPSILTDTRRDVLVAFVVLASSLANARYPRLCILRERKWSEYSGYLAPRTVGSLKSESWPHYV